MECFNDRTVVPYSVTIHKTETTDQIILVSLDGDVDTDQFTTQRCTCLLNTEGLTVARQTSDECRIKDPRLDDLLQISKVAKGNKLTVNSGNQIVLDCRSSSRCLIGLLQALNHSQIPGTTLDFEVVQLTSYSTIVDTFATSKSFDISSVDAVAVLRLDFLDEVRHVCLFGMYIRYCKTRLCGGSVCQFLN